MVAGEVLRNVIIGTYNRRTGSVFINGSLLAPQFTATIYLASCQLKIIGPIPVYSDDTVLVSFTYVNTRAWNVIVPVPLQVVRRRYEPVLPSAYLLDQQDCPAPLAPARLKP